ncbi:MAG: 50S ribosomal protein L10 [Vigna little leaf phytoplasma]|nr:50S ribosomal protein L10 [Vigna little leaf phytoplasma]
MLRPNITKKNEAVNLLAQNIYNSKLVILFEFQGLKVSDLTQLRCQLRKYNSKIKFYSNNIIKRAFETTNYTELVSDLRYPKALLISEQELIEPARILNRFAKENKFLKIISGAVENQICSAKVINDLANLVSREQLLMFLFLGMLSPLQELIMVLNFLIKQKTE